MITVSVEQMREADRFTISKGTPSRELMRRAAQGVFDAYPLWEDKRTLIICGPGNNGGDGYALAVIMKAQNLDVTVLRVSDKFSEDGAYYHSQCIENGISVLVYGRDFVDFSEWPIIVDCMLGTGFEGVPREPFATIIGNINSMHEMELVYVISVDINSGMNGDTGEGDIAVVSDLTVSIGYYKNGFFCGRAPELIGNMVNVDIGIEFPDAFGFSNLAL